MTLADDMKVIDEFVIAVNRLIVTMDIEELCASNRSVFGTGPEFLCGHDLDGIVRIEFYVGPRKASNG